MSLLDRSAWLRVVSGAAVMVVLLAACGGGNGGGGGGGGDGGATETVEVTTMDNEFEPAEISIPTGAEVTVTVTNEGEAPHTFTSEELDVDSGTIDPGQNADVTFTAPDGDTEFICTFHESAGMVGTITVE
jgi:nitrite reductase (NO-forming)